MASATHPATAPQWTARRDDDNPFAKFAAQRSTARSTFAATRTQSRSRLVKWALILAFFVGAIYVWRSRAGAEAGAGLFGGEGGGGEGRAKTLGEALRWGDAAAQARGEGRLRGLGTRDRTQIGREKAALVMLVRNRELPDALASMKQIEERFNVHYRYPWVFLNDEPFTAEFKSETLRVASGATSYGLIATEQWSVPPWIDEDRYTAALAKMKADKVIYGDSRTYRHMCRYNSGFFFRHPLLEKYDFYWRVEPMISYYCDQLYDPFTFMREHGKKYSFVISMPEYRATIETLWSSTQEFAAQFPQHIAQNNSLAFITDEDPAKGVGGVEYNNCHFWSNFEIGDLRFWRSQAYLDYFNFLDQKGGFYYERWGDAPVHSIAAALLLRKDEIHFWEDMGYKHIPWGRCPTDEESWVSARCVCPFEKEENFDTDGWSCLPRWWKANGRDEHTGKLLPEEL